MSNHLIMIHDLKCPDDPQGRTYKQINAEKKHRIPIGALVEHVRTGVRLFVVFHGRDCDKTPLYGLCADKNDTVQETPGFGNRKWHLGYPEDSLRVIS